MSDEKFHSLMQTITVVVLIISVTTCVAVGS